MPRSAKAPPLPPEPDYNEILQNDVARIKRLLGLDVNRLALGSEVEGIVEGGPFGSVDYTITGVNAIEFVNVSSSIAPQQNMPPGPPAAPENLIVSSITTSFATLNCDPVFANPAVSSYKFYYSTSPAFSPATISNPSAPNTGIGPLSPGTVYYTKCMAINALGDGSFSSTVSFTTIAIAPTLLLHLDGDLTDSVGGAILNTTHQPNGFMAPGRYGSSGLRINYPTDPPTGKDYFEVNETVPGIQLDFYFTLSFWIYPQDLSALTFRRVLAAKREDIANKWQIDIDNTGVARLCMCDAGTVSVYEISGFTTGSWQMVTITSNRNSHVHKIYRNAVLGTSSASPAEGLAEPPASAYNRLLFGKRADNEGTTYFEGYYDEVQYYKGIELTQAQITNLFTTNSPMTVSTDTTAPPQTVGLAATAISDTQINLAWTASTAIDLNYYNVYRGTTSGFTVTPGVTTPIGTPSTNSYSDFGRTASTTYYYKVLAVDASGNMGTISTQASATTQAPLPVIPSLELHLDSALTDSSSNNHTIAGSNTNGFLLPGVFGTAGWRCNYPVLPAVQSDNLSPAAATNPASLQMDTTTGFSLSFWVNPQDISALSFRRVIMEKADTASNKWSIQIDSSGIVYFFVKKTGVEYKRQKTGFSTGSWQHVAAVFNGATNTVEIYRDAVAGASSVATGQYGYATDEGGTSNFVIGYRRSGAPFPDGRNLDTHYVGAYDEIRYYKSIVLTPTQVTNLKNTNAP